MAVPRQSRGLTNSSPGFRSHAGGRAGGIPLPNNDTETIAVSKRRQSLAGDGAAIAAMAAALLTAIVGCGKSGPTLHPVVGKVTIDGQPAKEGGVVFHDESNGLRQFVGGITPDGIYKIMHLREEGAPAGKYRVTVFVTETPMDANGNPTNLPRTLSDQKFMDARNTPLSVEVTDAAPAGSYDLAVTR